MKNSKKAVLFDDIVGFKNLSLKAKCQNKACMKSVVIQIRDNNHFEFGFICPYCEKITSADLMMDSIMRLHKSGKVN